jgi:CDP-diacylglycerol--glycerol-3-phosphate 3-phosphatidyltransferase
MARELIVSGFRLVASGKNMVIAADWSGKIKTFFTDITIIVMLISLQFNIEWITLTAVIMLILSTLLTVYSGAECIIKNRAVLKENK